MSHIQRSASTLYRPVPRAPARVPLSGLEELVVGIYHHTSTSRQPLVAALFGPLRNATPERVVMADLGIALPRQPDSLSMRAVALSAPASLRCVPPDDTPEYHDGWVVHLVDDMGRSATQWWGMPEVAPRHMDTLTGNVDQWCRSMLDGWHQQHR